MMFDHELKQLADLSMMLDEPTVTEPQAAFAETEAELAFMNDDDVLLLSE
jgi:hypothetical protein